MHREETSSPIAYMERIMLISVIDAKEYRDIVNIDITNVLIQTPIDKKPVEDKTITRIKGVLVHMLVHMDLVKYGPNVVY